MYETTTAGVTIQSPQLDINTVAGRDGSCLTFRNGHFLAGPESAGPNQVRHVIGSSSLAHHPNHSNIDHGVYRKGGPLAVTDANLLLGRLIPDYFPKIFGESEEESLNVKASKVAFEKVAREINESTHANGGGSGLDLDEIVYG